MQEEVNQKTIALTMRCTRLTADILKAAIRKYLEYRRNLPPQHGKTTVRKLVGMDQGTSTMEVKETNIRDFERVAKKYNVDFAVKKDRSKSPPKYLVFFKGRDTDVIASAFREFVNANEKRQNRPSLREKLKKFMEMAASVNRSRERTKEKSRGQEL